MVAMYLLVFAGVIALGAMSPGPDLAVVMRRSIIDGRAHGIATATGVATGVLLWAAAAVSGVAALIAWLPGALTALKLAGAAYLLYLGVQALRHAGSPPAPATPGRSGVRAAFRDGLLCNVLNPKTAVFFVALLPQFLPAHPTAVDTVLLSAVAVTVTATWFITVASLVAAFRRLLARPAVRRTLDRASGAVLIGLGVRLAATGAR